MVTEARCSWCLGEFFGKQQRKVAYCSPSHRQKAYRFNLMFNSGKVSFDDLMHAVRTVDVVLGTKLLYELADDGWPDTEDRFYSAEQRRKLDIRFQAPLFEVSDIEDA